MILSSDMGIFNTQVDKLVISYFRGDINKQSLINKRTYAKRTRNWVNFVEVGICLDLIKINEVGNG
ncbi:hypothetical protein vBVpaMR16F_109 [Vibrio phage vB_VpaM_R16F]|nr:hypothetical protein vBVpaMR16F_109 [Vibrio phage vB_VpaM_R16F]